MLAALSLPRSTYYCALAHPPRPTRPELWDKAREVFSRTPNGCGHRQVAMCIRSELGVRVADKTVLKLMREAGLRCGIRRRNPWRAYSSYRGDSGAPAPNLLARDFSADGPWQKLATDVTEVAQPWGKAYLAPVIDLYSGEVLGMSVSRSPNLAQQRRLLGQVLAKMPEGAGPVLHSDMGWQYQHDWWRSELRANGVAQSMSRKGNCLDNACAEGFFGHFKDEVTRGVEWPDYASFERDVLAAVEHWNTRRRQKRLRGLTPAEYRRQASVT